MTTRTITLYYESCCHVGKIRLCEKRFSFLLARLRHSRELEFPSRGALASAPGFMRARHPAARCASPLAASSRLFGLSSGRGKAAAASLDLHALVFPRPETGEYASGHPPKL